jgi:DNA invertase Pin-like site-specific DNA recombinase
MHGIKVLMAKNYIDNLSEEASKGMLEKAEQGFWPSSAPLGYRNIVGPNGRNTIEPDSDVAPMVARLFEWYATGNYALEDITAMAQEAGLVSRRSKSPLPRGTIHKILRNRIYMGDFEWKGRFIGVFTSL